MVPHYIIIAFARYLCTAGCIRFKYVLHGAVAVQSCVSCNNALSVSHVYRPRQFGNHYEFPVFLWSAPVQFLGGTTWLRSRLRLEGRVHAVNEHAQRCTVYT